MQDARQPWQRREWATQPCPLPHFLGISYPCIILHTIRSMQCEISNFCNLGLNSFFSNRNSGTIPQGLEKSQGFGHFKSIVILITKSYKN